MANRLRYRVLWCGRSPSQDDAITQHNDGLSIGREQGFVQAGELFLGQSQARDFRGRYGAKVFAAVVAFEQHTFAVSGGGTSQHEDNAIAIDAQELCPVEELWISIDAIPSLALVGAAPDLCLICAVISGNYQIFGICDDSGTSLKLHTDRLC